MKLVRLIHGRSVGACVVALTTTVSLSGRSGSSNGSADRIGAGGDLVPAPVSPGEERTGDGGETTFPFDRSPLADGKQFEDISQLKSAVEQAAIQTGFRVTMLDPSVLGLDMRYFLANSSFAAVAEGMTIIESIGAWSSSYADQLARRANDSTSVTGTVAVRLSIGGGTIECVYLSGIGSSELLCRLDGVVTQIVRPPVATDKQQSDDLTLEVGLMEQLAANPLILNPGGKALG